MCLQEDSNDGTEQDCDLCPSNEDHCSIIVLLDPGMDVLGDRVLKGARILGLTGCRGLGFEYKGDDVCAGEGQCMEGRESCEWNESNCGQKILINLLTVQRTRIVLLTWHWF